MKKYLMAHYLSSRDTPDSVNPPSRRETAALACVLSILMISVICLAVSAAITLAATHTTLRQEPASVAWGSDQLTVTPCRYVGTITQRLKRPALEVSEPGFRDFVSTLSLLQTPFGQRGATLPECVGL